MLEVFNFSAVLDSIQAAADTSTQPIQKLLYDRKSAAFALSISLRSLGYLVATKQLNALKMGSKVMFTHGELVRFSRMNHPCVN
jgi:hypothetical protein